MAASNGPSADPRRFGAVVVLFYPDDQCIARANRLSEFMTCVVVDNTPAGESIARVSMLNSRVLQVRNFANLGIATAQNQGVAELLAQGIEFAFLFDQDSDAPATLLQGLMEYAACLSAKSENVALIGPAYFDARFGAVTPFVQFLPFRLRRIPPYGTSPVEVDFLISSGSCLNLKFWRDIGPMEDDLFIDFVDVEWCLRAKRKGFRIVGLPWLVLTHSLGEQPVRLLNRPYPLHSPIRRYYQVRNLLVLLSRGDVSWIWKSREVLRLPVRVVIYVCKGGRSIRANASMVWRGIRDGFAGRLGPFRN